MTDSFLQPTPEQRGLIGRLMRFCLTNKLIVALIVLFVVGAGVLTAPFDWELAGLPREPVATDAIPDIGENQQIVFTDWPGRSPQDVDDQVTYPLTNALLGVPGVKTIRGNSMFGFSTIFVIFKENVDFYWARSRIIEKLNSLPEGDPAAGGQARPGARRHRPRPGLLVHPRRPRPRRKTRRWMGPRGTPQHPGLAGPLRAAVGRRGQRSRLRRRFRPRVPGGC